LDNDLLWIRKIITSCDNFSEDIDLVQVTAGPFGPIIDRIRERLSFLGEPRRSPKAHNFTLYYRFESEFPPMRPLHLKVETNTREHFIIGTQVKVPFSVNSKWFTESCEINTYSLEELLGTKLRALYQRRKGRDLYDLFIAMTLHPELDKNLLIRCYRKYMEISVEKPPERQEYISNLEDKMANAEFLGDTIALLPPDAQYNPVNAYNLILNELISVI